MEIGKIQKTVVYEPIETTTEVETPVPTESEFVEVPQEETVDA